MRCAPPPGSAPPGRICRGIDQDVRDAWLGEAPQPLAESIVELGDAHNVHQARDIAVKLIRSLLRYLSRGCP